jgi:AcrR family transcriptional regulator
VSSDESTLVSALPKIDGRRQRSERTRQVIIEAYLRLLQRKPVMPTASQIAGEAGYSPRSVFERFSDLDTLSLATADYAMAQGRAEAAACDVDGDRPTRIRSHVQARALTCEKWLPLWRVLANQDQPELRARVTMVRSATVECMKLMYAPELALLPEAERDLVLSALATLISFESWDQLRHGHGESIEAGQAVWRAAIDRMLPVSREPRHAADGSRAGARTADEERRVPIMTRTEITQHELLRAVSENMGVLRIIAEGTRRQVEKAALQQIIDAYDMLVDARRLDRESIGQQAS